MNVKERDSGLTTERRGRVALLRLNRPKARNALNPTLLAALAATIREADEADDVGAIVITGGTDVFSAGADIDALKGIGAADYLHSVNRRAFDTVRATRKPVISGVAGYCLGGGCELALATDIVIAGHNAFFGQPEITIGIIPGAGGTQFWADRAGGGAQAVAALTGAMVDAYAARRMGLVERVVPAESVVDAAIDLAAKLAEHAPLAMLAAKAALRSRWAAPLNACLEQEVSLMAGLLASEDAAEGTRAFIEKRQPRFTGR